MKRMLAPKEVAEYLSISVNAAYELMHREDFPSFKISYGTKKSTWRVNVKDIENWIENQKKKKQVWK